MDRRNFMKTMCTAGAGGMLFLAGTEAAKAQSEAGASLETCEREWKLSQAWIVNAVENMDAKIDEKEKIRILEDCGRACARRGAMKAAAESTGDLDKFLGTMKAWIGEKNVRREGATVFVTYSQCYCPNVQAMEKVPASYCNCSRGWAKEMFETVLGKPVAVELLSSIKRGDKECRLVIRT